MSRSTRTACSAQAVGHSFRNTLQAAGIALSLGLGGLPACGGAQAAAPPPPPPPQAATAAAPLDAGSPEAAAAPPEAGAPEAAAPRAECPDGMIHVKGTPAPRSAHLPRELPTTSPTICTSAASSSRHRRSAWRSRPARLCIDRYEYPNKKGAHPPVMVDWYTAAANPPRKDKRLCYKSEWTTACEGPTTRPFPLATSAPARSPTSTTAGSSRACRKSTRAIQRIRDPELKRLDESVPSGGKPRCVSGYGVYDMTGNFDEWTCAITTARRSTRCSPR